MTGPIRKSMPLEHWNLMSAAQIFAPLPPYPWLIKGLHVAPGRVTLLNGYANAGKTIVAMSIALAVAANRPVWNVYDVTRPGKVLHMNGEIGSYIARERYQRIARGMGIDAGELALSSNLVLANYPRAHLDEEAFENELAMQCTGVQLVIVDSLRAFSGSLNENDKEIGLALLMLARVSDRTGATILVLHHNRKPNKDDDQAMAALTISGSSSIFGGCECAFVMAAREKGGPVYVKHERSPIGVPLSDFGLSFEDIEAGGDRRWGLEIVHLEPEQLADREAASLRAKESASLNKHGEVIIETMTRFAGHFRGSRSAFRAACGIGDAPFRKTLAELIACGAVIQDGSYHSPEWRFAYIPDPNSNT